MERFGPCQKIKKEINAMNVNNVGAIYKLDSRERERISDRAGKRHSDHLGSVDHLPWRQTVRVVGLEEAVQRHDANAVTRGDLGPCQLMNNGLNPPN